MSNQPRLLDIARILSRDGSLTFGGGGPTAVALEDAIVTKGGWLGRAQFRLAYALSRLTPGTNMLAFCTALGWQMRGVSGAVIALAAASAPCSFVTVLITVALDAFAGDPRANLVIQAAAAITIGFLAASCWPLVRPHMHRTAASRTIALLAGAVALDVAGVPPIRVLALAAIAGAVWRERT